MRSQARLLATDQRDNVNGANQHSLVKPQTRVWSHQTADAPPAWWRRIFPRWERLTMADKEIKRGIVLETGHIITLIVFMLAGYGGTIAVITSKIDAHREAQVAKEARDEIREQWTQSEMREIKNQGKINAEYYRQALENDKQILGYVQGSRGQRLDVKPPPGHPDN